MGAIFFHSVGLIIFFGPKKVIPLSKTKNVKMQIIQSLLLISSSFLFFSGIHVVGLATAHAIFFLTPILVTALAIPILGERLGLRRVFGVISGFIGALIILRPELDNFSPESLYFIGAAVTASLYQLATRWLGQTDHAYTTLFYTAAPGAILSR